MQKQRFCIKASVLGWGDGEVPPEPQRHCCVLRSVLFSTTDEHRSTRIWGIRSWREMEPRKIRTTRNESAFLGRAKFHLSRSVAVFQDPRCFLPRMNTDQDGFGRFGCGVRLNHERHESHERTACFVFWEGEVPPEPQRCRVSRSTLFSTTDEHRSTRIWGMAM